MVFNTRNLLLSLLVLLSSEKTHSQQCNFDADRCEGSGFGFVSNQPAGSASNIWDRNDKSIYYPSGGPSGPAVKNGVSGSFFLYSIPEYNFETAYYSPVISAAGDTTACVSFMYNMYAANLAHARKLFVAVDFSDSSTINAQLQAINPAALKTTSVRDEQLVHDGVTTQAWIERNVSVSIPTGKTHYRVYFQIIQPTGGYLGPVSLDFIKISPGECSQEGVFDGGWSAWTDFTTCSVSCGWGTNQKTRNCNNPLPVGGRDCLKTDQSSRASVETVTNDCYLTACSGVPTDGGWSAWAVIEQCSQSCGGGTEKVKRQCNFPEPNGGKNCLTGTGSYSNTEEKSQPCNTFECLSTVMPGSWGNWSECSGTCGFGTMVRTRTCNPPGFCANYERETRECSVGCRTYTCPATPSQNEFACNFETNCYQQFYTLGNTNYINIGSFTPSMNTGPVKDVTFPTGCGNFMYFNSLSSPQGPVYIASPQLLASTGQQCVQFYVNMYSKNAYEMGNLTVYFWQTSITDEFIQQVVWESSSNLTPTNTSWYKVNIDLNNINNMDNYIIFFKINSAGPKSDMSIDEFSVTNGLCSGKVDGYWSAWTAWSQCSETCGSGQMSRERKCDSPAPRNGGTNYCVGSANETQSCSLSPCPVSGNWSTWGLWRKCSVSCDNGTRSRERTCSNPTPAIDGDLCLTLTKVRAIKEVQMEDCKVEPCDRNGNWGLWSEFSPCSVTCGSGNNTRSRVCDSPQPRGTGHFCQLDKPIGLRTHSLIESNTQVCDTGVKCPIHGNWGSWSQWGACNQTCGGGSQMRERKCDNPAPLYEGNNCKSNEPNGSLIEYGSLPCNTSTCCPENGTWAVWGPQSSCSVTCGIGTRTQNLTCTTATCNGTQICPNPGEIKPSVENCDSNEKCDIDGTWGSWIEGECSVTCGTGKRERVLPCNNPPPRGIGLGCELYPSGETFIDSYNTTVVCEVDCNRNGSWGEWINTTCSVCNSTDGLLNQTRHCNNPPPYGTGQQCVNMKNEYASEETKYNIPCFQPCSIHGNWSNWRNDSGCNQTCGGGYITFLRECNSPTPMYGGDNCTDTKGNPSIYEERYESCNSHNCSIDGNWAEWTQWTDCVGRCGDVNITRTRNCTKVIPEFGGLFCLELDNVTRSLYEVDSKSCGFDPCPVIPEWGEWVNTSDCSVTCHSGFRNRTRYCTEGHQCLHPYKFSVYSYNYTEQVVCNISCLTHGNWTEWTAINETCDVTCGNGTMKSYRNCTNPAPYDGGNYCVGENNTNILYEEKNVTCYLDPCPINGSWANWTIWTNCSKDCDSGKTNRTRTCTNPQPQHGGLMCVKKDNTTGMDDFEEQDCFIDHCSDPFDCNFNSGWCNFTKTNISRWFRDVDSTHTIGTVDVNPYEGSHFAYFESSSLIPPFYPYELSKFGFLQSNLTMYNLPAFTGDRCFSFWHFTNSTLNSRFEEFKVYQTSHLGSGSVITEFLYLNQSLSYGWTNVQANLTNPTYPYDITFFGLAAEIGGHGSDKAIDDVRFYNMDCNSANAAIIPVP